MLAFQFSDFLAAMRNVRGIIPRGRLKLRHKASSMPALWRAGALTSSPAIMIFWPPAPVKPGGPDPRPRRAAALTRPAPGEGAGRARGNAVAIPGGSGIVQALPRLMTSLPGKP